MVKIEPFDQYPSRYDNWFEKNPFVYQSELQAVEEHLPEEGRGIEIGIGSGRFSAPLNVQLGVEPSYRMRELARNRGLTVVGGTAEALPFGNAHFDFALMVTTICFLDDLQIGLSEAHRVLRTNGRLIVGFVDKDSMIGRFYLQNKDENVFYRHATFYTVDEVVERLKKSCFKDFEFTQTLFHNLDEIIEVEPFKRGYGDGSFVVVSAVK
jgi:SAM-dependent methyltransferase